jgi:hypothetical protein
MRQTSGTRSLRLLVWVVLVLPPGGCSREAPATRGSAGDGGSGWFQPACGRWPTSPWTTSPAPVWSENVPERG